MILDNPISITSPRYDGRLHRILVQNHIDQPTKTVDGLTYYESVQAENIDAAIGTALGEIYYLSAIISCLSGISVSDPYPYLAFTTGDRKEHEFVQFGDFIESGYSTGKRQSAFIADVALKIQAVQDEQCKDWLKSSLHAFKKAQMYAEDPYTHFILAWISLELLDRVLERKLEPDSKVCSECGRQMKMTGRGLEEYLKGDTERIVLLKKVTDLRARIFHRAEDFAEVRNEAIEHAPFLRDLYINAMDAIIGGNITLLKRDKPISRVGNQIVLRGRVELSESGRLLVDETVISPIREEDLPHFEIRTTASAPHARKEGGSESLTTYEITAKCFPHGAVFSHKPQLNLQGVKVENLSITKGTLLRDTT